MPIRRVRTVLTGLAGGEGLTTMYFTHVEATTGTQLSDAVLAFWNTNKAVISNNITMTLDPVQDILDEVDGTLLGSVAGQPYTATGTDTNPRLPSATQGLLRLTTGAVVGGERLKGHLFIPGPTTVSGSEKPTTAYATAVGVNGDALVSATASLGPWVVWSRKNGTFRAVNDTSVWNKWAVLRSRRD